jgi:carboxypeptidase C (cathepsin A)
MKTRIRALCGMALVLSVSTFVAFARQTAQQPPEKKPAVRAQSGQASPPALKTPGPVASQPAPLPPEKPLSITHHSVTIGGRPVAYTATVGTFTVNKGDEQPGARIFFMAYTQDGIKDLSTRPIAFVFNGGPGSSSVWLHLGAWGPRRVVMNQDGFSVKPPFGLTDNENSLLDVTDLIFIDPVSTGYSRPLPGENKSQFHGVAEDIASVGEFIRLYVTRYERWASPKFILGESYGTTRAAGLAGYLQGRTIGMYLNGIILISSVLDFQTIRFAPGNNLTYVLFLPHYTATAWYHKKLPPALQSRPLRDVLEEAGNFALNKYSVALLKGNRLSADEAGEIADRLAAYSGLSREYVRQSNLRVRHDRFVKELLRTDFQTVGRLDSRFKGRDADAAGETYEFDPASAAIQGAFSTMFNSYVRTELGYKEDLPYAIYGSVFPWNFQSSPEEAEPGMPSLMALARRGGFGVSVTNLSETLRRAMTENPFLQVFCANGYYDGATPYFEAEYTFSQIGLNGELKDRIRMGYYEAGHMMYIHTPSHTRLKADIAGFIGRAAGK